MGVLAGEAGVDWATMGLLGVANLIGTSTSDVDPAILLFWGDSDIVTSALPAP